MYRKLSLGILLTCASAHAAVGNASFANLPLRFEADGPTKFLAHGDGYTLFLTQHGATLASSSAAVHMKMIGANRAAPTAMDEPLPGVTNYLIGNDPSKWRAAVAGFGRVEYRGIYPGIDLVYYGNQRQLEYDFVVAPGAGPRRIKIAFDGATNLRIDRNGDLLMQAAGREMRFRRPAVYQASRRIDAHYTLNRKRVGFAVANYDHSLPLVIDPVLAYATFLGGPSDTVQAVAIDSTGNVYFAGTAVGETTPGRLALGGSSDAFVTKMNAAGTALIYSTYIGGSGADSAYGLAVDSSGNAYVTGGTTSADFPTVNPIQGSLKTSVGNAWVAKVNAAGSALMYSTYLGGSGDVNFVNNSGLPISAAGDRGIAIAIDSAGNAYVAGNTFSPDFPTVAPFQSTNGGIESVFVTKLNAAGSAIVYSTFLGGNVATDGPFAVTSTGGIAVDSSGSAYVAGEVCANGFPTVNAFQPTLKSRCNAFVTKFAPSGSSLVYSTYLGGSSGNSGPVGDQGSGIAVDAEGNAYVVGSTSSTDFPVVNALQSKNAGTNDAFIAKLNPSGSALVYSTYLGGGASDGATAIALDSSGNAYVTGFTNSGVYGIAPFPTVQPTQATLTGPQGALFVAELNTAGSALVYSTYFGNELENGVAIAVDAAGNAYVVGQGFAQRIPLSNAIQTTPSRSFLAKIAPSNGAGLAVGPQAIDYSSQLIGTPATSMPVTVIAAGNQPLTISSITTTGDYSQTNNCGSTLTGGATCTITAAFAPTVNGIRTGTLTVAGTAVSSQSVRLTGIGLTTAVFGVAQNAASFSTANVAGSLASIFGNNLALTVGFASQFPLPTTLQGATLSVTGPSGTYPVPLVYVSPTQINFQIPWEVAGAPEVTLKVDAVSVTLPLSPTAPAIYALNSQGTGPGAITIGASGLFAQPVSSVANVSSRPVDVGEFISLYASGLGPLTSPPPADGNMPKGAPTISSTATVSIGGISVTPSYAGLAPGFAGLYQVNAQVPVGTPSGSAVPVTITAGGVTSNTVTIAVQ